MRPAKGAPLLTCQSPRYVGEDESDMRAIKDGWYAVAKDGMFVSGPFLSRHDCLEEIRRPARAPMNLPLGGPAGQNPLPGGKISGERGRS
jgi:hypothetical protein